jgi:hypothetical protein
MPGRFYCVIHTVVIQYFFKQQYSRISGDKSDTSDAADADINKRVVLILHIRRKILTMCMRFLKKLSSDNERAKTDFSKTRKLRQYRRSVATVRYQLVRQKKADIQVSWKES